MNDHHPGNLPTNAEHALDFLWLELTNRCNLRCTHCYADSGPQAEVANPLSAGEYKQLIVDAHRIGCRRLQFIGGEPTLNRALPDLIRHAAAVGFDFIELYSNLTRLPAALLDCLVEHRVHVATSVHAPSAEVHDRVTQSRGSFERTIANLRKVVSVGLPVRVAVVNMEDNAGLGDETRRFLRDEVGIENIRVDRVRTFGRGGESGGDARLQELCGACARGTLCIGPDGKVSPCIMSKPWAVGSIRETALADIVASRTLADVRGQIDNAVVEPRRRAHDAQACLPDTNECGPVIGCMPLNKPGVTGNVHSAVNAAQPCLPDTNECGPVIGCTPLNRPAIASSDRAMTRDAGACLPDVNECGPVIGCPPRDFLRKSGHPLVSCTVLQTPLGFGTRAMSVAVGCCRNRDIHEWPATVPCLC